MPAKVYVDAPPARRLPGDAGARRRAGDAQVGDLVSRATPSAACRWSPGRCWSRAPRPASCWRSSTAPRSPRCAPAPPRRSRRRRSRARTRARSALIGCGVNGAWAARCLAAAGYGPGVCADPRAEAAEALAAELGWEAGARERGGGAGRRRHRHPGRRAGDRRRRPAAGPAPRGARRRRARQGRGRARRRSRAAALFCDEWEQASKGGELSGAVAAGAVERDDGDRDRRRAARPRAPAAATTRRSPCSTRPGSRSRTWGSPPRCSTPGAAGAVEAPTISL